MVAMATVLTSPSCSSPSLSFSPSSSSSRRSTFACWRPHKQSLGSDASSRGDGDEIEGVSQNRFRGRGKDERVYLLPDGSRGDAVFKSSGMQKEDKGSVYGLKEQQDTLIRFDKKVSHSMEDPTYSSIFGNQLIQPEHKNFYGMVIMGFLGTLCLGSSEKDPA